MFLTRLSAVLLLLVMSFTSTIALADEGLTVYSSRKEALIKPILDDFTKETGVHVRLLTGKADALLKRIVNEGRNTPADLLITVDAGRLHRAKNAKITSAFDIDKINQQVPTQYRDPEKHWVGLSVRSRVIMYSKDRVNPKELSTYEALSNPKWKGRICVRSSNSIYNQSLTASLIKHIGKDATEKWAKGIVANLSRKPQGGDRDQIKAVASGQCDIAIANTYYLAAMVESDPKSRAIADKVSVFWPNQNDRGAHVNISGAAIVKFSKNKSNALKLIEFLTSDHAQSWYAEANGEYPVRNDINMSNTLATWGTFKADTLSLDQLGRLNKEAVMLLDRSGWR